MDGTAGETDLKRLEMIEKRDMQKFKSRIDSITQENEMLKAVSAAPSRSPRPQFLTFLVQQQRRMDQRLIALTNEKYTCNTRESLLSYADRLKLGTQTVQESAKLKQLENGW